MDKEKVIKEFKSDFDDLRSRLGFSVSFEDLESEFFILDYVLEMGFVRENLVMQITSRIIDYFRNWSGYLNGVLVPSGNFVSQTEAKLFNSEIDKKEMWNIIKVCMKFSSMYSFMFLSRDEALQAKFIDETYLSWKDVIRPYISKVMGKVYLAWGE